MILRKRILICWLAGACALFVPDRDAEAFLFNLAAGIGGDSAAFSATAKGIMVVDTLGNGFQALADPSLLSGAIGAAQYASLGADDLIFAPSIFLTIFDFKDGNPGDGDNEFGFDMQVRQFDTSVSANWSQNDPVGLFWFNSGTSNPGDAFSFFRSDDVAQGDIAFLNPAAGATNSIVNTSTKLMPPGSTTTAQFKANDGIIPIPEASSSLLVLLAGGLFLRRRRAA